MDEARCATPIPLEDLIDGSLGELPGDRQAQFDAHVFECGSCSRRLEALQRLGAGIARAVAGGRVLIAVTGSLVDRLRGTGARVREYRLGPGETVHCTAGPEDTALATRFVGEFAGLERLRATFAFHDPGTGARSSQVVDDVPVDRESGEAILLFPGDTVRAYPRSLWTVTLEGDAGGTRRVFGPYTLDHTPWEELPDDERRR